MPAGQTAQPLQMFISYAHEDSAFCQRIVKSLAPLERSGKIEVWYDGKIVAGQEWKPAIDEQVETADIILLLISVDFMASDYINDNEMNRALARHDAAEACVIPILLKPTDYEGASFAKLQGLPLDRRKQPKAITKWTDRNEAFVSIVQGIRKAAEQLQAKVASRTGPAPEASADPSDPASTTLPTRTLHQLRQPTPDFVGRTEEIETLAQFLRQGAEHGATVIIRGMGGLGKTELSYVIAQHLAPEFPDAQLLIELRGEGEHALSSERALLEVIQTFDPQSQVSDNLDQLQARYRSALRDKRVLIVADDAKNADQVRRLLPPAGCVLIMTTRRRFELPGAKSFDLGTLPEDKAVAFVQEIAPRVSSHAARLARLCGYLPLALRVSASLLASDLTRDIDEYLETLANEGTRLTQLRDPEDQEHDVEAAFVLSYEALPPEAQSALRQLSVFPASFDLDAAKAIISPHLMKASSQRNTTRNRPRGRVAPLGVEDILRSLYRRSWVEYDAQAKRYSLHDVVRAFAAARLMSVEEEIFLRYAKHYVEITSTVESLYQKGGEWMLQGLAIFDQERVHIDASWHWALTVGNDDVIFSFTANTAVIGNLRYHAHDERIPQGRAALASAQRLHRRVDQAQALYILSSAYQKIGDIETARDYTEQMLAIAYTLHNRSIESLALTRLGVCCILSGYARQGIEHHMQALSIAQAMNDRRNQGSNLASLGSAYASLGELRRSIEYYTQALNVAQVTGDRNGEEASLVGLGSTYANLGDVRRAIDYVEHGLSIARAIGDRNNETAALGNLGLVYASLGDIHRAIEHSEQALNIAQAIGNRNSEGAALGNLGRAYIDLGKVNEAIELCEQSLQIKREVGNRTDEGHALHFLGIAYATAREFQRAWEYQEQALLIARDVEARFLEIQVLNELGNILIQQDKYVEAQEQLDSALQIAIEIEARHIAAHASWNLGHALERQGDMAGAIEHMQVRVNYEREIGHLKAEEHAQELQQLRQRLADEQAQT